MEELRFDELEFVVGYCAICDRDVLTYPDPEAVEETRDQRCCVHCDAAVQRKLRPVSGDALPKSGYGLLETQGCGNPSCGGGQCSRRQNEH